MKSPLKGGKMKKLIATILIAQSISFANELEEVKKKLQDNLQNTKILEVSQSPIKGIYEVILENGKIIYSDGNYLIFGRIFSLTGKDITSPREEKLILKQIELIDKDRLLKIGSGKVEVIEITDPECPYCRKAEEFFDDTKVSRYIIFLPLDFHKNARNLSLNVLCSQDKEKTYKDTMAGKFDKLPLKPCKDKEDVLSYMYDVAMTLKVKGTPVFFVKTKEGYKRIDGANPYIKQLIEKEYENN